MCFENVVSVLGPRLDAAFQFSVRSGAPGSLNVAC